MIYNVKTYINGEKTFDENVKGDSPKQLVTKFSNEYFKTKRIDFVSFKVTNEYGMSHFYKVYLDRINKKLVFTKAKKGG
ncbi:hypothetical protein KKG81_10770 [bacterium]|nr:hypothetical protein [bacterium]